jgi:glycosyltransferase involved in cell wall biosynthesis
MTETLQALEHEVTVLTGFPNWPSGKLYPGYRLRLWQREEQNGIQIIRVPLFPDHSRSVVKRALNYLSFAISATVLGFWLVPRPDVMHVISTPITVGLPAMALSLLWRIRFTLEILDMWPETLRATGMIRQEAVLRAVGAFARLVYRRASAIRVVSPGFRRNLIEKGVPASKVRVISNWVDTDFYRPSPPDRDLAQKLGLEGRFTVMYAGTIGLAQGLDVVLDAAERLRDLPQVHFVLAGDGVEYARLRAKAESRDLANVRFLGRVPSEGMSALYALADVLFLHLRNDPLFHITIPHKVFSYMASGKMVLAAIKGDAEELVRSSCCGVVCPPDDAEALASAVRDCYGLSPAARAAFGENGRRAVCESYDRRQLVERLGAMIEQAARSPVTQYPG